MILVINSGSSSIKFALYSQNNIADKIFHGQISRIGSPAIEFESYKPGASEKQSASVQAPDYSAAIAFLTDWLEKQADFSQITAIGHRIVHGMQLTDPALITEGLLSALKEIISYDPDHLPNEIKLVEAFKKKHPGIAQFACFDTGFHQNMPRVAKLLPVPRRFDRIGIQRYGFHGLSYSYLMQELEKQVPRQNDKGRVILAHLGNGASLAAVRQGKSIDTSMGFTPASGLPMSSRSGDLDPGVACYMMKKEGLSPEQFNHLVNHASGLLGISETSGDMTELLQQELTDTRSAEAVDFFCYQVKKWIGAFAAALEGLDTLVFAGGIGENAPVIRSRICKGLGFLGIEPDEKKNNENADLISAEQSRVAVRVMHTDEERMIAKIVSGMLTRESNKEQSLI